MRLNKRLVEKHSTSYGWGSKAGWFYKQYDKYTVNVEKVLAAVAGSLALGALAALLFWGFVQWTQVSSENGRKYDAICKRVANGQPYFVRAVTATYSSECVIGPEYTKAIRI